MTIHDLGDVASLVNAEGRPRPGQLPLEILREAARLGVRLEVREGVIGALPPARLPVELRAQVAGTKLPLLAMLADPRRTAYLTWEAALAEVSSWWKACARTMEPPWLDDEPLTDAVREAIKATVDHPSLVTAIEAIETWGRAWVHTLAEAGQAPTWRHLAPDGQPWPETAYWRCPGCQGTFTPCEYLPNTKRLCRQCLRAEAGRESLFELPLPLAPAMIPAGKKRRSQKSDSDAERSRCPKCRRVHDRDVMVWVGSGAEAARWCMGCALKLGEERAGAPSAVHPPTIEERMEGLSEEVSW